MFTEVMCVRNFIVSELLGKYGMALSFDGINDYAKIPLTPELTFSTGDSFTLDVWIKTTDEPRYNDGIISNYLEVTQPMWGLFHNGNDPNSPHTRLAIWFDVRDNTKNIEYQVVSPNKISDGRWHHVVAVRDTTNHMIHLYVDGDLVRERNDPTKDINSGQDIWIAIHYSPRRYWAGTIDELRIYNRALSAEEIKAHYGEEPFTPIPTSTPIATAKAYSELFDDYYWTDRGTQRLNDFAEYWMESLQDPLNNLYTETGTENYKYAALAIEEVFTLHGSLECWYISSILGDYARKYPHYEHPEVGFSELATMLENEEDIQPKLEELRIELNTLNTVTDQWTSPFPLADESAKECVRDFTASANYFLNALKEEYGMPVQTPTSTATSVSFSNSGGGEWKYYREISIRENSGKILSDYQVLINLNPSNFPDKAKYDGSDLRFADKNGRELKYWIEEWDSGSKTAKIWVKVPSIAANGEARITMYCGNPSASTVSNGENTFLIFDDFEDNQWNDIWTSVGSSGTPLREMYSSSPIEGAYSFRQRQGTDDRDWIGVRSQASSYDDVAICVKTKILGLSIDVPGAFGVAARWDGGISNTHYTNCYPAMVTQKESVVEIYQFIRETGFTVATGQVYKLEFALSGDTLKVFVDDIEKISTTDSSYNSGYVGFFVSEADAVFDLVRVREYTDPEPTITISVEQSGIPILTPATLPTTPTQLTPTPAPISPTLAPSIITTANTYKVLLDGDVEVLDTVTTDRGTYHVVEYSNLLPFASGVEVFSPSGVRITDSDEVDPVLASIAWKQAAGQLSTADIETLRDILKTSQSIESTVTPVVSTTSYTLDKIDWLKYEACISVPLVGEKCAWDYVKTAYPEIDMLATELQSLDDELTEWKGASSKVSDHLPSAISGLEQVKGGGQVDPQLQSEITESMSTFSELQTKTNQMSSRLSSVSSTLSEAESSVRGVADTPVVGGFISEFADAIDSMNDEVMSLKQSADSFSRDMQEQSSKLSAVTDTANKRTVELQGAWNARQNASARVYGTLIGLPLLIFVIVVVLVLRKRRRRKPVSKEEIKEELAEQPPERKEISEEVKPMEEKEPPTEISRILDLKAQRENISKNIDGLKERLAEGKISEDTYNELKNEYNEKISTIDEEIKTMKTNIETDINTIKPEIRRLEIDLEKIETQHEFGEINDAEFSNKKNEILKTLEEKKRILEDFENGLSKITADFSETRFEANRKR
jgi:hypothetical protein